MFGIAKGLVEGGAQDPTERNPRFLSHGEKEDRALWNVGFGASLRTRPIKLYVVLLLVLAQIGTCGEDSCPRRMSKQGFA